MVRIFCGMSDARVTDARNEETYKVHTDGGNVAFSVRVVGESQQKT